MLLNGLTKGIQSSKSNPHSTCYLSVHRSTQFITCLWSSRWQSIVLLFYFSPVFLCCSSFSLRQNLYNRTDWLLTEWPGGSIKMKEHIFLYQIHGYFVWITLLFSLCVGSAQDLELWPLSRHSDHSWA
jgi:hypothetical protein